MIVSHAPTSMNCLILFLYYYLYFIASGTCFNVKLETTEIFEHKTLALTCILQSRWISWWAAIYVHDEYDDNLFTNDKVREARSTSKMIRWYGCYNNYREEDLGRKKRRVATLLWKKGYTDFYETQKCTEFRI